MFQPDWPPRSPPTKVLLEALPESPRFQISNFRAGFHVELPGDLRATIFLDSPTNRLSNELWPDLVDHPDRPPQKFPWKSSLRVPDFKFPTLGRDFSWNFQGIWWPLFFLDSLVNDQSNEPWLDLLDRLDHPPQRFPWKPSLRVLDFKFPTLGRDFTRNFRGIWEPLFFLDSPTNRLSNELWPDLVDHPDHIPQKFPWKPFLRVPDFKFPTLGRDFSKNFKGIWGPVFFLDSLVNDQSNEQWLDLLGRLDRPPQRFPWKPTQRPANQKNLNARTNKKPKNLQ
jgi:hypothetical protein